MLDQCTLGLSPKMMLQGNQTDAAEGAIVGNRHKLHRGFAEEPAQVDNALAAGANRAHDNAIAGGVGAEDASEAEILSAFAPFVITRGLEGREHRPAR